MDQLPDRVTFYTRPGCHLCDDAREVVRRVCAELEVGWHEVDITGDEELLRRFTDQVPVTLVDGQRHDFWSVEESRLRSALS